MVQLRIESTLFINYVTLYRMTLPRLPHLIFMTYLRSGRRDHSDSYLYPLGKGDLVIYRTHSPCTALCGCTLFPRVSSAGSLWRAGSVMAVHRLTFSLVQLPRHCFWFHWKAIFFFNKASSVYWVIHFLLKYSAIKCGYNLLSFNLQRNVELKKMQNYYFDLE